MVYIPVQDYLFLLIHCCVQVVHKKLECGNERVNCQSSLNLWQLYSAVFLPFQAFQKQAFVFTDLTHTEYLLPTKIISARCGT